MQTNKKENNPGTVASENSSEEIIDSNEVQIDDEGKALDKAIESSKKLRNFKAMEPEL